MNDKETQHQAKIFVIEYGSKWYSLSIALRHEVLRAPLGLRFTATQIENESKDIHIVCAENDAVVAVLVLTPIDLICVKMRQVAVLDSYQRKGIGKKMVLYAEQIARTQGFEIMQLNARKTAVEFYHSLQYQITGNLFYEIGIPHFKFQKVL